MLDLKLLQSFREVAVRRSFSAAAEALSFTQPAVSQHIARLERALDTPLLVRESRGVTLTPAGEALLRHAEQILGGVRRAEAEVRELAGAKKPLVRLGAFQSAAAAHTAGRRAAPRLRRLHAHRAARGPPARLAAEHPARRAARRVVAAQRRGR